MIDEMPPFGNYPDDDVERAFQWFLGFIDPRDWLKRRRAIEAHMEAIHATPSSELAPVSVSDDRIAWYLNLVDTALHSMESYEPVQGSRVLPIFKRTGADLDLLRGAHGVDERVRRILTSARNDPDGLLFEMIVALIWRRNGWDIEFIEECSKEKRPDVRATKSGDDWFIECKRLQKSSDYSERERLKWLKMWSFLREVLVRDRISAVFDVTFHVELHTLPDTFLLDELATKLRLLPVPCTIVSNATWQVSFEFVDYQRIHQHLSDYAVKYPSPQVDELIAGYRDPNRGFTSAVVGRIAELGARAGNNRFLDELEFATGAFWSCDSEAAIETKARDIRRQLAKAVDQLPVSGRSVVHIGLETLDGQAVEAERFTRILNSVRTFDSLGKDLRWVYCHLFQSYAPPNATWIIDETVYYFGNTQDGTEEPLTQRFAFEPETETTEGVHWLLDPP